ncbi:unnamed protein product [Rhizophagus irregularis]|nr:unnamed protein product [Rhizophagus irregularis]
MVLDYLDNHIINSKEIYNRLLSNRNTLESIFFLGYFNYTEIETTKDKEKAYNLFINASEKNYILAQYYVGECYRFGSGITKNQKLIKFASGQMKLSWFYNKGIS